jgi:hypothetical protein
MNSHALVLAAQISAPCAPQVASQSPQWLQMVQATGGIATTVGVLIALYIAIIREPREASEVHRHHIARLEALERVKSERFGAQARKLVPSCVRTPILGDSWWAVRIDNASSAMVAILAVDVRAIDADGVAVPDGCSRVDRTTPVDEVFDGSVRAALSESLEAVLERPFTGAVRQAIRDAVAVHFVTEWPRTLPPNQHAVMSYITTDPNYGLRITIDYEDQAGFLWRRTDTDQPIRLADYDGGNLAMMTEPR